MAGPGWGSGRCTGSLSRGRWWRRAQAALGAAAVALLGGPGVGPLVDGQLYAAEPCAEPLTYRVLEVDGRYRLGKQEVRDALDEAAALWERAAGEALFRPARRDPDLGIRLVYGQAQAQVERHQRERRDLERAQERHRERQEQLKERVREHERDKEAYKQEARRHERRRERFESRLERWEAGDMPRTPERRDRLKSERAALQEEAEELNRRGEALEREAQQLQARQEELVAEAQRLERRAEGYNRAAEELSGFQAGQYRGRPGHGGQITVYQFDDPADLRTVLAHELGHALGIEHVAEADSLMHREMTEANRDPRSLSIEDRTALRQVCR